MPALSSAAVSVGVGIAGAPQATFTLSLTLAGAPAVTVAVATAAGTASPGRDYTDSAVSGLTIPAGQSSSTFQVPVHGDTEVEGHETFGVHLSNAANATIADGQAIGRITNDDMASLSVADVTIAEGGAGTTSTATFVLSLSAAMPNPVLYDIATGGGTAAAGSDYVGRQLAGGYIDAGRTRQVFEVAITGDANVEANETFNVTVSNVSGATVGDGSAVGTITNDDGAAMAPTGSATPVEPNRKARSLRPKGR
jgi:hypothetical protein